MFIINRETGETTPLGQCESTDIHFESDFTDDKAIHNNSSINKGIKLTLEDCEFDKDALSKMLKQDCEKAKSVKMVLGSIIEKDIDYMRAFGFVIFPMRKAKSVRVQKKWNKKYGFRGVNSNMKPSEYSIDFENKELYM